MNRSAIDRGLFNAISYKSTSISENKKGTHDSEVIELPPQQMRNYKYNYSKLDENGIIKIGSKVVANDVLVGKVYYNNDEPVSDCSLLCKSSEEGVIADIHITKNASGYKLVKIKIKNEHIPEIGDKFAALSAQKGTNGAMFRQEDMPFTKEGIVPDIIINANAIPSRMTINMLIEMLAAKEGTLSGKFHDGSAFCHDGEQLVEELGESLCEYGYERTGYETLYNGFTGEPIKAKIFIGPAYYQRLKHLVSSKMHSRNFGNVQSLTRQPCAGRSRNGGKRLPQWNVKVLLVCVYMRHY